jgi:hypothetical protein
VLFHACAITYLPDALSSYFDYVTMGMGMVMVEA